MARPSKRRLDERASVWIERHRFGWRVSWRRFFWMEEHPLKLTHTMRRVEEFFGSWTLADCELLNELPSGLPSEWHCERHCEHHSRLRIANRHSNERGLDVFSWKQIVKT